MAPQILLTLDGQSHDPNGPFLAADDLGAVRGDAVFETALVRSGRVMRAREHLDRLGRSAAALGLAAPNDEAWWSAAERASMLFAEQAGDDAEGALRMVYTRGRESAPEQGLTAYITVAPVADRVRAARADGVSALLLGRGYSVDLTDTAPWQLLGAKTVSYATNMAALRFAAANGADDVIFTSSEGFVLEGPRSSVVIARDKTFITPPAAHGILPGITVAAFLETAADEGFGAEVRPVYPSDLVSADGVWLVSSVTLCARVHSLDGNPLPDAPLHEQVASMVDDAVGA